MEKLNPGDRFLLTRYFLIIFMIGGSILTGMISLLYNLEARDHISRMKIEEQSTLKLQKEVINHSLKDIVSDLKFLSRQNELSNLLESGDESYVNAIEREYLEFSRQKARYDQIRLIDDTGMEKIRVNFNNGTPMILPGTHLAPKGNRYYYKNTMVLSQDEIYVSPFDLNIEKGKLEKPLKPMIRFGTPVFDHTKKKRGIVILNYLGDRLIASIREAGQLSDGDIMLVNADGYWFCSPEKADEWGFMIEKRKNRKFSIDFPEAWKNISSSNTCQISNEKGLFTAATVWPLSKELTSSSGSAEAYGDGDKSIQLRDYYWKIISHIPVQRLHSETRGLLVKLLFLAAALFLLAAIPSWLIAKTIVIRKQHQVELYWSANYDKLTELPNRSLFLDRLNQNLKESKRYEHKFAILFIDLDGFKSVNDTLGHDAGDVLLIKVAERLLECVRESDTVARLGGDEFTVILSNITSSDDAKTVARKVIETLSVPFNIKGHDAQIGASVGVSIYPDNGDETEILLKKADDAMYLAKDQGKNDYRLSPP